MLKQIFAAILSLSFLSIAPVQANAVEKPKEDREGGIIGTGIVGIISELGSIIVNGQRVTFPPDAMARSVIGNRMATSLTPGETVVLVAQQMPMDWQAESIHLHYPVIGPVALDDGALTVLGVDLDLSNALDETHLMSPALKNGDWIAVSGLWRGETLMVSKLTAIDPQKRGVPTPTGLDAKTVHIGLFAEPMHRVIAQGYMSEPTPTGLYTILGSGVVSFTDQPQMIDTQTAGVFCIKLADVAERNEITPTVAGSCN